MKYLDLSFPTPEENLACDEALLEAAKDKGKDWLKVFPLSLESDGILRTRGMPGEDARKLLDSGLDLREITSYAP